MIICREIRHVVGGYVVEVRWPYGNDMPYGEVLCRSLDEVFELLVRADVQPVRSPSAEEPP